MSCVWSMADEVLAFVRQLAQRQKLVLFDPQSGTISLPERLRSWPLLGPCYAVLLSRSQFVILKLRRPNRRYPPF